MFRYKDERVAEWTEEPGKEAYMKLKGYLAKHESHFKGLMQNKRSI